MEEDVNRAIKTCKKSYLADHARQKQKKGHDIMHIIQYLTKIRKSMNLNK